MARTYDEIDERLAAFIESQPVFFVATAPLSATGHVNLSPKGLDAFRVIDRRTVGYVDLTGSGVETIAHLRENGRIVIMFCSFEGPPRILRLHGRGRVAESGTDDFAKLAASFPAYEGARSIIVVDVQRIADSCGFGVPEMTLKGSREQLLEWATRKGSGGLVEYRAEKNARSIDGLPGLVT